MPQAKSHRDPLSYLGWLAIFVVQDMGRQALFFARSFTLVLAWPWQFKKILVQMHFIGVKSLLVVCLTGAFTGMVLGLQGYYTLARFGSEGILGTAVALSLVRELGPVLTAFMVIARGGSAMAAELASMRISEQIDALTTMDINPIRFLVSPRLVAAVLCFPLLTAIFDFIGIMGGYLTGSILLGLGSGVYFSGVESGVRMIDVSGGFLKSLVFALVAINTCCFRGYFAHLSPAGFGSKAVSLATTGAVVQSCVLVLTVDYILTSFLL
jgi:phospholipid/cholesterol/gamma-HCH transport system permease protein